MSSQRQRDNYGYDGYGDDPPPEYKKNGHSKGPEVSAVENGRKSKRDLDLDLADEEIDPWKVSSLKQDYKPWHELSTREKWVRGITYPVKVVLVLTFLYLFICSLDFLSSAFKLLGGRKAGEVFRNSDILQNPIAGLMMGVLVTVLVQSSSTSTSIVISMVGAGILNPPQTAVPIIMGANIGTSVTNTIVAMGQITDKNDFRRAFAGATVHDMFNWLAVIVLLPIEIITGYLYKLSTLVVDSMHLEESLDLNQDLLKVITKPFTKLVISVSSSGIKKIAQGDESVNTIMKFCCDSTKPDKCCSSALKDSSVYNGTRLYSNSEKTSICESVDASCASGLTSLMKDSRVGNCSGTGSTWASQADTETRALSSLRCSALGGVASETECCIGKLETANFYSEMRNATSSEQTDLCSLVNATCFSNDVSSACSASWEDSRDVTSGGREAFTCKAWAKDVLGTTCYKPCEFLFRDVYVNQGGPLSDEGLGAILLFLSLILLCICLVCIVKLLQSLLQGPMARVIKKFVNADFPGKCSYFTGYLAILLGAGLTILVQSSSIFTSSITPLVGIGVIELERMYPLTLGSNIGTTCTGILSALAQDAESIPRSLQIAMCHLFFNISGILIFYPFPFFRPPIPAAKFLGNTTAKYRWFALLYLVLVFFALPAIVFGLSVIDIWMLMVLVPFALLFVLILFIKCLQRKRPGCLPRKLRNFKFLPEACRSLRPYDRCMGKICFCMRPKGEDKPEEERPRHAGLKGHANNGHDDVTTRAEYNTHL